MTWKCVGKLCGDDQHSHRDNKYEGYVQHSNWLSVYLPLRVFSCRTHSKKSSSSIEEKKHSRYQYTSVHHQYTISTHISNLGTYQLWSRASPALLDQRRNEAVHGPGPTILAWTARNDRRSKREGYKSLNTLPVWPLHAITNCNLQKIEWLGQTRSHQQTKSSTSACHLQTVFFLASL